MDKEKVIAGLECCSPEFPRTIECSSCPYEKICYHEGRSGSLLRDALALLKEQEKPNGKCVNE